MGIDEGLDEAATWVVKGTAAGASVTQYTVPPCVRHVLLNTVIYGTVVIDDGTATVDDDVR